MNIKILKTINLIKKSYNQPLVFHSLCNHLCHLMEGTNPMYEIKDDWSKILIYSVVNNNIPNQALESKIINCLRTLKKEISHKSTRLKIMIIGWYLKNRTLDTVNNIILFELVNNFLGITDYIDGLIVSILVGVTNSAQFGLKGNKKFRPESIEQMVKKVSQTNISDTCRILSLPMYLQYDFYPQLGVFDVQNNIETFFLFECVCFYAKFCKNEEGVKNLVPKDDVFIENLGKFIGREFIVEESTGTNELLLEDREIYNYILEVFNVSSDKNKFKSDLIEFISNLK